MAKMGLNTTFVVLLALAAVLILVGWFIWMRQGPKTAPTSPNKSSSQLRLVLQPNS